MYKYTGSHKGEEVVVSTTRPETVLGDTAVAVSPNDGRYSGLLNRGVLLEHPLRRDLIPLIADKEGVDPELGTGAVKVTPGHDPADFEIGQRHNLPSITVIDDNGLTCFDPEKSDNGFDLNEMGKSLLVSNACNTTSSL